MQYYLMFWPRNFCDDQVMLLKASESDNYITYRRLQCIQVVILQHK